MHDDLDATRLDLVTHLPSRARSQLLRAVLADTRRAASPPQWPSQRGQQNAWPRLRGHREDSGRGLVYNLVPRPESRDERRRISTSIGVVRPDEGTA